MSNGINVQLVFKDNSADDESMTMMALLKIQWLVLHCHLVTTGINKGHVPLMLHATLCSDLVGVSCDQAETWKKCSTFQYIYVDDVGRS